MYGHIYRMAEAVVEGAREVEGAEVSLYQVAELVPEAPLFSSAASGTFQLPRLASLPKPMPLSSARQPDSATCARRCGTFWTRQGHSGSVGLSSVRSAAFSRPPLPSTVAKRPRSPVSTVPCCITAW